MGGARSRPAGPPDGTVEQLTNPATSSFFLTSVAAGGQVLAGFGDSIPAPDGTPQRGPSFLNLATGSWTTLPVANVSPGSRATIWDLSADARVVLGGLAGSPRGFESQSNIVWLDGQQITPDAFLTQWANMPVGYQNAVISQITDDGLTVAGWVQNAGEWRAFHATIPGPTGVMTTAIASATLLRRRR